MKIYEVVPLVGVGPIALGMTRAQVHASLGACTHSFLKTPASAYRTDAWHNGAFQVFYGGPGETVEYIELSRIADHAVTCSGVSVFETPAPLLVEHIKQVAAVDTSDPEYGYSFVFPSLELSFWRPLAEGPESVYVSTIGIGQHGYYSNAA